MRDSLGTKMRITSSTLGRRQASATPAFTGSTRGSRVRDDVPRLDDPLVIEEDARALRLEVLFQAVDLLHLLAQVVERLGADLVASLVDVPSDREGRADGVVVAGPRGGALIHHCRARVGDRVPTVERVQVVLLPAADDLV